jgi:transposase
MQDTRLFAQILGLSDPWFVATVDLNPVERKVEIQLEHTPGSKWACPVCGRELACRDHAEERIWRHLDTCQFKTLLYARIPRVDCPEHGVLQVSIPWAEAKSRFTLLMDRLIIDVLSECSTVSGAQRILRITWDEAWGVMERAVHRGLARKRIAPARYIGVDEKAFRKGHDYMTVVCNLSTSKVEYVGNDRKTESLEEYYQQFEPEQLAKITAVAMDMWDPYFLATLKHVPDALDKIVYDRFHIMKHVSEAVDKVRRQEHQELTSAGDDRLKGTKYLWLYREEHLPDRCRPAFESLKTANLKVARAWALKESLTALWDYLSIGWARRFAKRWLAWSCQSGLTPMKKAGETIRNHLENILTFCRHRITNGVSEGLNSKIMSIKRKACGYRNREHFKTAIYFFCGGLDLYPKEA